MKHWFVATYKIKEIKRLKFNLANQNFDYYLPKITKKKRNAGLEVELLFPGYIFINAGIENYSALKYTIGIKSIIKFGNNISFLTNEEIESIQNLEQSSKSKPLSSSIQVGQDAILRKGPFKGAIVKICSLPYKERINILLDLLGSVRRVNIPAKDLVL